jgi:hypothetical protein
VCVYHDLLLGKQGQGKIIHGVAQDRLLDQEDVAARLDDGLDEVDHVPGKIRIVRVIRVIRVIRVCVYACVCVRVFVCVCVCVCVCACLCV